MAGKYCQCCQKPRPNYTRDVNAARHISTTNFYLSRVKPIHLIFRSYSKISIGDFISVAYFRNDGIATKTWLFRDRVTFTTELKCKIRIWILLMLRQRQTHNHKMAIFSDMPYAIDLQHIRCRLRLHFVIPHINRAREREIEKADAFALKWG